MSVEPLRKPRVISGNGGAGDRKRIAALEARMTTVETSLKTAVDNTTDILAILTATKSVAGYAKKYGARIAIFIGGVAVAKGWIAAETINAAKSAFGF